MGARRGRGTDRASEGEWQAKLRVREGSAWVTQTDRAAEGERWGRASRQERRAVWPNEWLAVMQRLEEGGGNATYLGEPSSSEAAVPQPEVFVFVHLR